MKETIGHIAAIIAALVGLGLITGFIVLLAWAIVSSLTPRRRLDEGRESGFFDDPGLEDALAERERRLNPQLGAEWPWPR